jgi:putative endonuclease
VIQPVDKMVEEETFACGEYMKIQQQFPHPAPTLAATSSATPTHLVYLVACADHTLYTGYTSNVERRLAAHNAGKGARYTRGRRPVTLLATWPFASKGEALRAERTIKSLSREQKWQLVLEVGQASLGQNTRIPGINDISQSSPETDDNP